MEVARGKKNIRRRRRTERGRICFFISLFPSAFQKEKHASAPALLLHARRRRRPLLLLLPPGRPPRRPPRTLEGLGAGPRGGVPLCRRPARRRRRWRQRQRRWQQRGRGLRVGHGVAGRLDGRVRPDFDAAQRGHGAWEGFGVERGGGKRENKKGTFNGKKMKTKKKTHFSRSMSTTAPWPSCAAPSPPPRR